MSKKQGLICGGIAGVLVIVLVVVFCLNPFGGKKKGTDGEADILASTGDVTTETDESGETIQDDETLLAVTPGTENDVPDEEATEEELAEEEEAAEEIMKASAESTVLFTGGTDQSFEPTDLSWFLNAADDDIITVVYTCTNAANAGWGILGWGATVNDVWVEGPAFSADATTATAHLYSTFTVGELKSSLGITASSTVGAIKLGAWNGGKIISLSVSPAGKAPVITDATAVPFAGTAAPLLTDASGSIIGEETAKGLTGSYVKIFNGSGMMDINIAASCAGYTMGDSINISVTLEGDGGFNGSLGTTEGSDWHWTQNDFSTDKAGTVTCSMDVTPTGETAQIGIWYVGGTAVGVKSISLSVTKKGTGSGSGSVSGGDFSGCSQTFTGPANIEIDLSAIEGFEAGDTVTITAQLVSNGYVNGTIGGPQTDGAWVQAGEQVCDNKTVTWSLTVSNAAAGNAELQFWWLNPGVKVGIKSLSAVVTAKGTGTGTGEGGTGTGEGGTGTGEGGTGTGEGGTGTGEGGSGTGEGGSGESGNIYEKLTTKAGTVLLAEDKAGDAWGTALTLYTALWGGTFDPAGLTENTCIVVKYESTAAPEVVFQDGTAWAKVAPVYTGNGYAVYKYEDMIAAYPDFTTLCALNVCAGSEAIVVKQVKIVALDATEEEEPTEPAGVDYAALTTKVGTVLLAEDLASDAWGTPFSLKTALWDGTFDPTSLTAETCIVVKYESAAAPEVVFQDGTAWAKVAPVYTGNGYAVYKYEDMIAAYPDFTTLCALNVCAGSEAIVVKQVKIVALDATEDEATEPVPPVAVIAEDDDNYEFNLLDYVSDLAVGDTVKITATVESSVYVNGGLGCNTYVDDAEKENREWLSSKYETVDNKATAELTVTVAYEGDYNAQLQIWWRNAPTTLTITSITVEKVVEEEPEEPAVIATLSADNKKITKNVEEFAEGLAMGDTVKVTVNMQGTASFNGAVGYNATVEGKADAQWISNNFESDAAKASTAECTFVLPYGENGVQIELYWVESGSVDITSITVEKVTPSTPSDDDGNNEGDDAKNEEPTPLLMAGNNGTPNPEDPDQDQGEGEGEGETPEGETPEGEAPVVEA